WGDLLQSHHALLHDGGNALWLVGVGEAFKDGARHFDEGDAFPPLLSNEALREDVGQQFRRDDEGFQSYLMLYRVGDEAHALDDIFSGVFPLFPQMQIANLADTGVVAAGDDLWFVVVDKVHLAFQAISGPR